MSQPGAAELNYIVLYLLNSNLSCRDWLEMDDAAVAKNCGNPVIAGSGVILFIFPGELFCNCEMEHR
jgi:hypothetical protein